ncbi:MAG: phosphodiester glycosidase family protein [Clostridia bacterium]|nr:phosphodiester glycosidase family protein [Clostridia bacterium]
MIGVTYQHIRRLESFGWHDVYVVKADLKSPGIKLDVLRNQDGISYLEDTLYLAKENDALAALNADFFASKRGQSGRGSAVGVEVVDGELKTSASVTEAMNTLYKEFKDDKFYIDAFEFDITLTAKNGNTDKIKVINKYDDLTGIVMYTDDWGEYSVGSVGGSIEVSVDKKGKVLEKVTESDPIEIPKGGFVLASHMSYNTFLLDNVEIGDKISVDIKSTPDFKKIETAVGGGGVVLREGVVPSTFSHNITGRQPRSAVGIDKTGTVITLVAVDGRSDKSTGMTQTELGYLMKELGCFTALNLDGGGSTLMALDRDGEKEVVNNLSGGSPRNVANSIGIMSTLDDTKLSAVSMKIDAEDNVFLDASTLVKVTSYDKYGRKVETKSSKLVYSTDGNGNVLNGAYYPSKTGVAHLTVKNGKITTKKTFAVLDNPREINFPEVKVALKTGEKYSPVLEGKDINGRTAKIYLNDTDVTVSGDAVAYAGGVLTAKKKGASVVCAKFGKVTANVVILVDGAEEISAPENVVIPDEKNTYKEMTVKDAFRFSVFGNTREESVLYDRFIMNTALYKMLKASDFQVFLGADVKTEQIENVTDNYVMAKNYNCFNKENCTFITLPNVSGTIFSSGNNSWNSLQNDINNSLKNLFVFVDRNYISNDEAELKIFKRALKEASDSGKNVFVFGGGFVNKNTIEDGVRYVNTAGVFPSISLEGTSISYVKYVLVTVNGEDVTYEYKSILGD